MSWLARIFGWVDASQHNREIAEFVNTALKIDHEVHQRAADDAIRQLEEMKQTLLSMSTNRREYQEGLVKGLDIGLANLRILRDFPKPTPMKIGENS